MQNENDDYHLSAMNSVHKNMGKAAHLTQNNMRNSKNFSGSILGNTSVSSTIGNQKPSIMNQTYGSGNK
jgi:hypothetical protein